ncbi:Histidine kinase of the competence regulon ComD [Streptococcus sp. DD11]|nr:Histidine kinase of the competence regulon ComD [Streptococcus sp. DD11]
MGMLLSFLDLLAFNSLISYAGLFELPIYFLFFSMLMDKSIPKYLSIFYGLFPVVLWNLLHRLFFFLLTHVAEWNNGLLAGQAKYDLYFSSILASLLSLGLPSLLHYDFKRLREFKLNKKDTKLILILDISMALYYILVQFFAYLQEYHHLTGFYYREMIVIIYIILFLSSINILDRNLRERIQQELDRQREIQLKNMADYSRHIEELYSELRSFRHDYINILRSLRLGIENRDLPAIERVYNDVLKDSGQPLNQPKFDLGRLVNIRNDALKSILSAKFLEAQSKQIVAELEVPQPIEPENVELLDLITIVSILVDNAIEAALEAENPRISIAFLEQDDRQVLIIENTTKDFLVNTTNIFEKGVSSKGENRGIGLNNIQNILQRYKNISLQTVSQDHLFRQEIIITKQT